MYLHCTFFVDDLLENGAMDFFEKLTDDFVGRELHGVEKIVKGKRVEVKELALDIECVPDFEQFSNRLRLKFIRRGGF